MICDNCKCKIEDDSVFCFNCGAKVIEKTKKNYCTWCGNNILPKTAICPKCGCENTRRVITTNPISVNPNNFNNRVRSLNENNISNQTSSYGFQENIEEPNMDRATIIKMEKDEVTKNMRSTLYKLVAVFLGVFVVALCIFAVSKNSKDFGMAGYEIFIEDSAYDLSTNESNIENLIVSVYCIYVKETKTYYYEVDYGVGNTYSYFTYKKGSDKISYYRAEDSFDIAYSLYQDDHNGVKFKKIV